MRRLPIIRHSSDSGSDIVNAGRSVGDPEMDDNSDRYGTGERMAAGKEPRGRQNADRDTDRVVSSDEAGLGGGLDQAEEARKQAAPLKKRAARTQAALRCSRS